MDVVAAGTAPAGNDAELVKAAQSGDSGAFENLAKRYSPRLMRIALGITRNQQDAEDVVQEALARAFARLDEFRGDSKFYTWLVSIAVNQGLMKLRWRRTRSREISFDDAIDDSQNPIVPQVADERPDPEAIYLRKEMRWIVTRALGQLTPESRAIFELREFEELPIEEIARIRQMNISTVKSRLLRARLKLRIILKGWFDGRTPVFGQPSHA